MEQPGGLLTPAPEAVAAAALNGNSVKVRFEPMPRPDMKWVLVRWEHVRRKDAAEPQHLVAHRERLLNLLPVAELPPLSAASELVFKPEYDPTEQDPEVRLVNTLNLHALIADKRARDEAANSRVLYHTLAKGIEFMDTARIPGHFTLVRALLDRPMYRNRPVHEVAHALGRHHAVHSAYGVFFGKSGITKNGACDETASGLAPDFPMDILGRDILQPVLGPMRLGPYHLAYGWDASLGPGQACISPFTTAELMSYCDFSVPWTWPSLHTHQALIEAIRGRFGGGPRGRQSMPATDAPCLLITGWVEEDMAAAALDPVWETLMARTPELPPPGEFILRLEDPAGAELLAAPFAPEFLLDTDAGPLRMPRGRFRFCLPRFGALGAVEILRGGVRLARMQASLHPPSVRFISPAAGTRVGSGDLELTWEAHDVDGDALRFLVDCSTDGGATWTTLSMRQADTALTVSADLLPAGPDLRFRVFASDGLHQAVAELPLTLADRPPMVWLAEPDPVPETQTGTPLFLRAEAWDPDDGELEGDAVRWLAGDLVLGTGRELELDTTGLAPGTHVLTVEAVDRGGQGARYEFPLMLRDPAALPELRARADQHEVEVSWPEQFEGWELQAAFALEPEAWFALPGETNLEGERVVRRLPLGEEGSLFFRLVSPP